MFASRSCTCISKQCRTRCSVIGGNGGAEREEWCNTESIRITRIGRGRVPLRPVKGVSAPVSRGHVADVFLFDAVPRKTERNACEESYVRYVTRTSNFMTSWENFCNLFPSSAHFPYTVRGSLARVRNTGALTSQQIASHVGRRLEIFPRSGGGLRWRTSGKNGFRKSRGVKNSGMNE